MTSSSWELRREAFYLGARDWAYDHPDIDPYVAATQFLKYLTSCPAPAIAAIAAKAAERVRNNHLESSTDAAKMQQTFHARPDILYRHTLNTWCREHVRRFNTRDEFLFAAKDYDEDLRNSYTAAELGPSQVDATATSFWNHARKLESDEAIIAAAIAAEEPPT